MAVELSIYRYISFQDHLPGDDLFVEGGGTCDTCTVLQSGLDVGAVTHMVTYDKPGYLPDFVPYTTRSLYTGLAGGTVGYGYISGSVSGSISTTEGYADNYQASFLGSFMDSLLIIPDDDALVGQSGTMNGSIQVDFMASTSAVASPTESTEKFGAEVQWSLSGAGQASGYQFDTDEDVPYSYYSVLGGNTGSSPAPSSITVPISVGFVFGEDFDFGLEFAAVATGGGTDGPGLGEDWVAFSALNFLNTITWQGISSVTDSEGTPIAFLINSESNTDWTAPATAVPAPAGVWLLGTGLAGLVLRRRRARARLDAGLRPD
jgi:hypothetical protein